MKGKPKTEVVRSTLVLPERPKPGIIEQMVDDERTAIVTLIREANSTVVTNAADQAAAARVLAELKAARERVEEKRQRWATPFHRTFLAINGLFKPVLETIDEAYRPLARRYTDYVDRAERERQESLERQRAAEQTVAASAPAGTRVIPKEAPPPVSRTVASEAGTTGVTKRWTFEVVDEAKVPREFLVLDPGLVNAKIRSVVRVAGAAPADLIPGLRVFQSSGVAVGGAVRS